MTERIITKTMNQIAIIFVGSCLFKGSPKSKKKPANTNIILIIKTTAYLILLYI